MGILSCQRVPPPLFENCLSKIKRGGGALKPPLPSDEKSRTEKDLISFRVHIECRLTLRMANAIWNTFVDFSCVHVGLNCSTFTTILRITKKKRILYNLP